MALNISEKDRFDVCSSVSMLDASNKLYIFKDGRQLIIGDYSCFISSCATKHVVVEKENSGFLVSVFKS